MNNNTSESSSTTENQSKSSTECGPGCDCGSSGINTKAKIIICLIVVVIAGVVLVRALSRKVEDESVQGQKTFNTTLPETVSQTLPVKPLKTEEAVKNQSKSSLWGNPIESFASLGKVASNKYAVFIFLPAKDNKKSAEIKKQIEAAATKIQAAGNSMSAYILDDKSQDYQNITTRMPTPCVLVLVKGRGMSAVPDNKITEQNLIRALVTASRPSGACGPSTGGCGPSASGCQ